MIIPIIPIKSLLSLTLLLISCQQRSTLEEVKSANPDTAVATSRGLVEIEAAGSPKAVNQEYKRVKPDLIWSSELLKIFGDTSIDRNKIYWSEIKFELYLSFEDFSIDSVQEFNKVELNWDSNPSAYSFRTRIRNGYSADKSNFFNYYTLTFWGCGSPCQSGVLIDRRTGEIYDLPPAALGYDYRSNSRMLIVNRPDSSGFYADCSYCKPEVHIWNEQLKRFEQRTSIY